MKNKKLLTVTVGTSAYNEEQNILNLLKSIISQKENTIKIVEIIVISDGSKDRTVEIARSFKDRRINVIDSRQRLGQPSRIGQLLKMFKGDVFVLIDSDMVAKDTMTIERLASKFGKNKKIGLVCGETLPIKGKTFIEKAINNYRYARAYLEKKGIYSFGKTAYCAHAFLAYSKEFANSLEIPRRIINPDAYSYFKCITSDFIQMYERKAVALYRSPQIIRDHIHQSSRHLAGGIQLCDYFGKEVVDKGFYIPTKINLKILIYQLVKNPFGYIFLKMLNIYCGLRGRTLYRKLDIRWTTIKSSKMSIL